jgi:hypothetical protein
MRRRPFPKGVRGEYTLSRYLFIDTTLRWRNLDKPTIAQVQGYVSLGGWMFAAAMDLVVASDDAKFLPSADAVLLDSVGYASAEGQGGDVPQPLYRCSRGVPAGVRQSHSTAGAARGGNDGARARDRWERSLYPENGEMGDEFGAGFSGSQQLNS